MARWEELLPGAILVAFVVFLSSFAGAKKFAMKAEAHDSGFLIALRSLVWLGHVALKGCWDKTEVKHNLKTCE